MPSSKVLISILNWNNAKNTIAAITSVLQSDYEHFTIVVLDNNSVDDSCVSISSAFPDIQVWHLKSNLGYAGAHKKAAQFAVKNGFDLLWILNNDVQVFTFTLTQLVLAHQRNSNALIGSVSLQGDGKTIHFGGGLELKDISTVDETSKYNQLEGKNFFETGIKERAVSDIEGASFIIPISIIKRYGFIDTRYFLYGEETAYCYKLRIKHGIQSYIIPSARVIHTASDSFKISPNLKYIKAYYFTRNTHILRYKYLKHKTIEGYGGLLHYLKFFCKHYLSTSGKDKDNNYWLIYYDKLGAFHALLGFRYKYLEPNNFLEKGLNK